ncbi:MAG: NUDIX hydrolase [Candidatus Muiribacterium halophilum]|uniref:NUDIX hydrolase n=1 Tax=Muiribacterium halophilum TaxID=2053465 RepID=A0A2N5ZHU1_MUIH1|nr:MAG: NUDIX hydrolase [Candidatus Muirbacterium halophilum]
MLRVRIAIVIIHKGKVLLVKHRKKGREYWLFPGGGIEMCETVEHCAIREVMEETGLNISLGELLFTSESIYPDGSKHVINMFFLGFLKDMDIKITVQDRSIKDAAFFDKDQIRDMTIYPNVKKELFNAWNLDFDHKVRHLGNRWE